MKAKILGGFTAMILTAIIPHNAYSQTVIMPNSNTNGSQTAAPFRFFGGYYDSSPYIIVTPGGLMTYYPNNNDGFSNQPDSNTGTMNNDINANGSANSSANSPLLDYNRKMLTAQRKTNKWLLVSWSGDTSYLKSIRFDLLDKNGKILDKRVVSSDPASIYLSYTPTAESYRANLRFKDGTMQTFVNQLTKPSVTRKPKTSDTKKVPPASSNLQNPKAAETGK